MISSLSYCFHEKTEPTMEWEIVASSTGGLWSHRTVMTEEQLEALRLQIAIFAAISEQLVEMHKSLTISRHDTLAGTRLDGLHYDPPMTYASARPRWTPTPVQREILEGIYNQESGSIGRHRMKGIAQELSQYGQISESNVYNWFQNRKARMRRRQASLLPNSADSEAEAAVEHPSKKDDLSFYSVEGLGSVEEVNVRASMSSCEDALSDPGSDHS